MEGCKNCKQWQDLYEEEIGLATHQRGREVFFNDEKIVQKQRRILKGATESQINMLKSILSETLGPEKVEQLLKDQWQKYYRRATDLQNTSNPAQSGEER